MFLSFCSARVPSHSTDGIWLGERLVQVGSYFVKSINIDIGWDGERERSAEGKSGNEIEMSRESCTASFGRPILHRKCRAVSETTIKWKSNISDIPCFRHRVFNAVIYKTNRTNGFAHFFCVRRKSRTIPATHSTDIAFFHIFHANFGNGFIGSCLIVHFYNCVASAAAFIVLVIGCPQWHGFFLHAAHFCSNHSEFNDRTKRNCFDHHSVAIVHVYRSFCARWIVDIDSEYTSDRIFQWNTATVPEQAARINQIVNIYGIRVGPWFDMQMQVIESECNWP